MQQMYYMPMLLIHKTLALDVWQSLVVV